MPSVPKSSLAMKTKDRFLEGPLAAVKVAARASAREGNFASLTQASRQFSLSVTEDFDSPQRTAG
jgi:hypothetical protein